jgi:predicted component of type VI protein secretion system
MGRLRRKKGDDGRGGRHCTAAVRESSYIARESKNPTLGNGSKWPPKEQSPRLQPADSVVQENE